MDKFKFKLTWDTVWARLRNYECAVSCKCFSFVCLSVWCFSVFAWWTSASIRLHFLLILSIGFMNVTKSLEKRHTLDLIHLPNAPASHRIVSNFNFLSIFFFAFSPLYLRDIPFDIHLAYIYWNIVVYEFIIAYSMFACCVVAVAVGLTAVE